MSQKRLCDHQHWRNSTDEDFFHLQRFVILMYDKTSGLADVNVCRKYLFTKRGRPIEKCPPTKDALSQHAKRAKLVSNIWISCLDAYHPEPDFNKWGWRLEDGYLAPRWTTLPDASKACKELISCTCKKQCVRCKCVKTGLLCTELCSCGGGCDNGSRK